MQELTVDLGDRSYPIFIGSDVLAQQQLLRPYIKGKQAVIVSNETVAPLYLQQITAQLEELDVATIVLPDGERFKNLDTLNRIFDELIAAGHNRTTTLIALGGGVVGDMTGFAAACYQRGVAFIQVPTTLLAQVDSSVGGKTAVNHPRGKNMIGAFYQPQCVLADTGVLHSLPAREYSAGLAEVVKYGLLGDADFFAWLEENADALLQQEPEALQYAVRRSCELKADIVSRDETEQGVRALLNLGHTFGHAIETCMNYQGVLHGEAVAIGMVMAADMSARIGNIAVDDMQRSAQLLQRLRLETAPPAGLSLDEIRAAMQMDKKVVDKKLRLVLMRSIGDAYVTADFDHAALEATLTAAFEQ
jgi:3-dehydroquinate synthase